MADDTRSLELLVAVRRRLAAGDALSVDDLIHLTRETVMTDPIEGRLAAVHLRVGDAPRAAAYFGGLFGWTFTEAPRGGSPWSHTAAGFVDRSWALALTDEAFGAEGAARSSRSPIPKRRWRAPGRWAAPAGRRRRRSTTRACPWLSPPVRRAAGQ